MAALTGVVLEGAESGIVNLSLTLGLRAFAFDQWPAYDTIVSEPTLKSTVTSALPVTQGAARAITGHLQTSFFDDFYNRIHVRPASIDLGYLISEQTVDVDVWNSYLTTKYLTDITGDGDGITVSGSMSFPVAFGAIDLLEYQVSVSRDGPSTIDTSLQWVFLDTPTAAQPVTGTRALAWPWSADWTQPVTESLGWLTDVLRSEDGSEQRFKLRTAPRQELSFSFQAYGKARRLLENSTFNLGAAAWALPVWMDAQRTSASLSIGATSITVPTTNLDYVAGGIGVLIAEDEQTYEAFEILTVASGSLTLKRALEQAWPAGTWIYPARISRLKEPAALRRLTADFIEGQATFESLAGVARSYAAEATTYRSQPVLTQRLNWRDGEGVTFRRQLRVLDSLTGQKHFIDTSDAAEPTQDVLWSAFGRSEIVTLRQFLYARAGRFKGIWVPTWMSDLTLKASLGSTATSLNVEACGLAVNVNAKMNRRDLRIELTSGNVYYRRVTGAAAVDATTEALTIDSALGVTVAPADVALISWMTFMRLDEDDVRIDWPAAGVAEASFTLTGPRNGI